MFRVFGLSLVFSLFGYASPPYHFDVWTADDGLPQNVIRGICQTADGYLWLATFNGLVRFDGVRFTIFDKSNYSGIESDRFTALYLDRKGALWLGTERNGVTRFHNGRFSTFTTSQGLRDNAIRYVTGDESGNVWVLSAFTIERWQESTGRFVAVTPNGSAVPYNPIIWEGGGFWASDGQSVRCFINGHLTTYSLPPWLPGESIWNVAMDRNGTMWIETFDGKQAKIANGRIQKELTGKQNAATSYRDRHGNLFIFDVGERLSRSITAGSPFDHLEKVSFTFFFEDREGNIWLGSDGRGLYRVKRQFITTYSRDQGLIANDVYPIFQDHRGAVWIGAWDRGLSRFHDGKFANFTRQDGLPSRLVTALAEDHAGHLWLAAHGGVRTLIDGHFRVPPGLALPHDALVQAIHQDRDGAFWLGTSDGLVLAHNGVTKTFTHRDGLAGDDVRVIVESPQGDLWLGGYGGLTRLRHGTFTRWTERNGLPTSMVRCIYIDRDGVIWIGTYDGGLARLQDGKLTCFTVRQGLFNNGVFQILEDAEGDFWISCNRGIYRVSKRELNEVAAGRRDSAVSVRYGRIDGMLNVECNGGLWPAGVKTNDGKLWFPTQNGVAVIDPSTVPRNPQPPPIVIESFRVDGSPLSLDHAIRVTPKQETFEIGYTAPSFISSAQIGFKYRLEGLESAWVDAGQRRTAYYSHVPPGSYTFTVIACNSDGIWNTVGKSVAIEVLAPFYLTWWFKLLVPFCCLVLARVAWRYRVSQLERANAVQQYFSRELIATQELERKRIAAELHDGIGQHLVVVKNLALFSLRAKENNESGDSRWMQEISDEASLCIEETRHISYDLHPFQLERLGLTAAIGGIIRTVSTASGFPISSQLDDIDDFFPEKLRINFYRIIQESLNNVMKHSNASAASVHVRRNGDSLLLEIRDDGCGFTASAPKPDLAHSGFGLTGMAERTRLLGGKLKIHSQPGHGTVVTAEIHRLPGGSFFETNGAPTP